MRGIYLRRGFASANRPKLRLKSDKFDIRSPELITLVQALDCLADEQRLRIVNLLLDGPLCVSHLQSALEQSQVAVSKRLAFLRRRGMVEAQKDQNWVVYQLPERRPEYLNFLFDALRSCAEDQPIYRRDLQRLRQLMPDERAPISTTVLRDYQGQAQLRRKQTVLFLCTENSIRSIFAEYFLRHLAGERFSVASAGAKPKKAVDPLTLAVLADTFGIVATKAHPKSMHDFRLERFDFVITLCDRALEDCPVWPGQPILAHWSSPDPSRVKGATARAEAFLDVAREIQHRVLLFANLPFSRLARLRLEQATQWIATRSG